MAATAKKLNVGLVVLSGLFLAVLQVRGESPAPADLTGTALLQWNLAKANDPVAAYHVAQDFAAGTEGAPHDEARAFDLFKQSSNGGYAPAMRMMGDIGAQGLLGRKVDFGVARKWYWKGAEALDVTSRYELAEMMLKGRGWKADERKGFSMLLCAGSTSEASAPAAAELAGLYEKGDAVVTQDLPTACIWSLVAARVAETDPELKRQNPPWIAENSARLHSLSESLPKDVFAALEKRRDLLFARQAKLNYMVVDAGPEEGVNVPPEGAEGDMLKDSDQLQVQVDFGDGKPHWFMVDTGVWFSEISSKLTKKLNLSSVGQAAADFSQPCRLIAADCHICGAEFKNLRFFEESPGDAAIKPSMEGTLGANFFAQVQLQVDIRNRRLTFQPRGAPEEGSALPVTFNCGTPFFGVTIEGHDHQPFQVSSLMDLGNWGGVLVNDDVCQQHPFASLMTGTPRQETYIGANGKYKVQSAAVPAVQFGPFRVANPEFVYVKGHSGACSNPLNIGLPVWEKFLVTLDYANAQVFLKPVSPEVTQLPSAPSR